MNNPAYPRRDPLIPIVAFITRIRRETPDTLTFSIANADGGKPFAHLPGQCAMLGVVGVGEAMFSISSSSACTEMEFSIKRVGKLTEHLHMLAVGARVTIRGAYGTPFPIADALKGKDLIFAAGGIGIAPLRSVIRHVLANRGDYGAVHIVYGARSAADLVYLEELQGAWAAAPDVSVHLTIDRPEKGWNGRVGFVPGVVAELLAGDTHAETSPRSPRAALVCGPPIMITHTLEALQSAGFAKSDIYTTLEMRMKCGIGKCGRCNIGHKYVCVDGPVFRCDELDGLPNEY